MVNIVHICVECWTLTILTRMTTHNKQETMGTAYLRGCKPWPAAVCLGFCQPATKKIDSASSSNPVASQARQIEKRTPLASTVDLPKECTHSSKDSLLLPQSSPWPWSRAGHILDQISPSCERHSRAGARQEAETWKNTEQCTCELRLELCAAIRVWTGLTSWVQLDLSI